MELTKKQANEFTRFVVKEEPKSIGERKVTEIPVPKNLSVSEFDLKRVGKAPGSGYSENREKFGPLAATDSGRKVKGQKETGFKLNPLLKGPLGIDDEEKRFIESEVQKAIHAHQEQAKKDGYRKGYDAGLELGRSEAIKRFQQDSKTLSERLNSVIQSFEGLKDTVYHENERFFHEVILKIAKMVILNETKENQDFLLRLTKSVIERSGLRENLTILVSPDDIKQIEVLDAGLQKAMTGLKNIRIESSPEVVGGGCILVSDWGRIDASLETQIQGIRNALIETTSEDPGTGNVPTK